MIAHARDPAGGAAPRGTAPMSSRTSSGRCFGSLAKDPAERFPDAESLNAPGGAPL